MRNVSHVHSTSWCLSATSQSTAAMSATIAHWTLVANGLHRTCGHASPKRSPSSVVAVALHRGGCGRAEHAAVEFCQVPAAIGGAHSQAIGQWKYVYVVRCRGPVRRSSAGSRTPPQVTGRLGQTKAQQGSDDIPRSMRCCWPVEGVQGSHNLPNATTEASLITRDYHRSMSRCIHSSSEQQASRRQYEVEAGRMIVWTARSVVGQLNEKHWGRANDQ